ncbi:hypothetical protein ACNKHL_13360 [Shigella flexneri]
MALIAGSMMIWLCLDGRADRLFVSRFAMAIPGGIPVAQFLVRRRNLRKLRLKIRRLAKHRQKTIEAAANGAMTWAGQIAAGAGDGL